MARASLIVPLLAAAWVAAPAAAAAVAQDEAVTPVQKVIQLLDGMIAKGKKEKHAEQVQFAAYKTFCDTTSSQKQAAIKEANEMIDVLKADIEKYTTDAATLSADIAQHNEDLSTWAGDLKASTKVREIENEAYLATHKDYTESIQAIEDGIATLKAQSHDTAQAAASLMQVSNAKLISPQAKDAIDRFLSQDPDDVLSQDADENLAVGAPEANAFNFQSQGIVDMLSKLQSKFEDEKDALEKEEKNAQNAFDMLAQDLKGQTDKATTQATEKTTDKAKALEAAGSAKGDLEETITTRDDDTKFLTDLTATCEAKAKAFAERQQLRAEELEAVNKAKEIIAGGAVSGAADKHLPALVQSKVQSKTSSLAQLRAASQSPTQMRVAAYLQGEASRINSRILTALSLRVSADPMKKVKKMIKDLIVKLIEEANQEAQQKGFCDKEMATNEQTRTEKTEAVETLGAEIDELTATIAKLTEQITELTTGVSDLEAAVAKATSLRETEKAKNTQTIKDAQEAQTAVAQALGVLKDFYAKASQATSFVQQKQKQPEIFDEPYKGMGAENGGVMGMIEVIQSDFARVESETTSAESEGQKEYEDFMADSELDKAQKTSDIEYQTEKKQNSATALEEAKTSLDGEKKELAAALAYWEKLKPSCVDAVESYEDKVARRKEEIESLQEALKILTE